MYCHPIIKRSLAKKKSESLLVLHVIGCGQEKPHNRFPNFHLSCIKNHLSRRWNELNSCTPNLLHVFAGVVMIKDLLFYKKLKEDLAVNVWVTQLIRY